MKHGKRGDHLITHGMGRSRFYSIFRGAKNRCENKNVKAYSRYGGNGVIVEWSSFEKFKEDMFFSYSKHVKEHGEKNTTLDRIRGDGNYSKKNCRWATYKEQVNNSRVAKPILFNGELKCMADIARSVGVEVNTFSKRIRSGWTLEEAIK